MINNPLNKELIENEQRLIIWRKHFNKSMKQENNNNAGEPNKANNN